MPERGCTGYVAKLACIVIVERGDRCVTDVTCRVSVLEGFMLENYVQVEAMMDCCAMKPSAFEPYPFSDIFEELGQRKGYYLVPSVNSMAEYVGICTREIEGIEEDETSAKWHGLQPASEEEAALFISEYRELHGCFEFKASEVRKIDWPDSQGWLKWMKDTVEALFVRSRRL